MSTTVLRSAEDLAWAVEVHGIPASTRFAILHGTEDAPDSIECWNDPDPDYVTAPDLVDIFPRPS